MFADKARAYPSEPTFRYSTNRAGSWPYPQTLDQAGKAYQDQTLSNLLRIRVNYGRKKFYKIDAWL